MTAVRRSARAKRQAQTVYDEAKKVLEEESPAKSRNEDDDSDSDDSNQAAAENDTEPESENNEEEPSSDDDSSEEEEEFEEKKPTPRRSPKKFKGPSAKRIGLKSGAPSKKKATRTRAAKGSAPPRALQTALTSLARKALDKDETPEKSLAAALLQAHKIVQGNAKAAQRPVREDRRTIYTAGLERVARSVVDQNKDDPNKAQTTLLNLIFRSVGGSLETNLNPEEEALEDMDNEQWAKVVTDLVDEMRHTPADRILFCADPDGAVHAAAMESRRDPSKVTVAASALGVREYRKIYEEFWYVLGTVALSEGASSRGNEESAHKGDEDSTDSDDGEPKKFTSTSRFQTEMTRDVIMRILELVSVGQPDVRAAATIAALHLARAVLDQTTVLGSKIDVATRQFTAAAGGKNRQKKLSRKAESLKHQIDSLKRTRDDLDDVVTGPIIQGVFMHRYRDSNMHIRCACIEVLSTMTLQRPDLFLMDKYLKYFGWMMHDKSANVRVASVCGLLAPFQLVQQRKGSKGTNSASKIDLGTMNNVISKFLDRIVECVNDVSVPVQEKAIALLLELLRNGFLDDIEEDKEEEFWNKINSRAVARNTSPRVRRDALYFIIEQLEPFDDEGGVDEQGASKISSDKKVSLTQSSDRVAGRRLMELVNWITHILTHYAEEEDPIDVELADFIIYSLREMPEHRSLATNWTAILKSISEDSFAPLGEGDDGNGNDGGHLRQRILVQMLACAAGAEVAQVASPDFLLGDVDPDVVAATSSSSALVEVSERSNKKRKISADEGNAHEALSVALLKSLPELLTKFKSDSAVLGSLTKLPRYLLQSVLSLPQRKKDFMAVMKSLTDIFLESADDSVLQTTALSLKYLSLGDHARARDGRLQLKRMAATLGDRLVELFGNGKDDTEGKKRKISARESPAKRRRSNRSSMSSPSSVDTSASADSGEPNVSSDKADVEYAIYLCLKRLRVLSHTCDVANLLESSTKKKKSPNNGIEAICNAIVQGVANRLEERKLEFIEGENDNEETQVVVPAVWKIIDETVHRAVAKSTIEALSFLLATTAWKLREAQVDENLLAPEKDAMAVDGGDEDMTDHIVVRMRDQLVAIVELCFEQYLPEAGDDEEVAPYTAEHVDFADSVQIQAGKIASDLRVLFPREWADAVNPLLRACALTGDGRLIGGFIRYFRSKEDQLRENERKDQEDIDLVQSLLLTMGRGLCPNWRQGNRREAGVALAHVTGSGSASSDLIGALSRLMKKVEPVRLLEAHMACLRQSYEDWLEKRPDELENDCPTDEEMAAFDEEERKHEELFHSLEQQGARLSMSLGVGQLRDAKLSPALLGFVKEGVRFAFSTTKTGGVGDEEDDDLMLGVRLTFLNILSRYINWIKKSKDQIAAVRNAVISFETELRAHEDFPEVHEDDLAALSAFRSSIGLKESRKNRDSSRSVSSPEDMDDDSGSLRMTPGSMDGSSRLRGRLSRGSSVSSIRSKVSAHSSLSPLYENEENEENFSPPSQKKRRTASRRSRSTSLGSTTSQLTLEGRTQSTIEEESEESSGESSS